MTQNATSKFKILRTDDNGKCATYELNEEDHTLGNALRHMILKNPNVKFCGYALPHPNERKINIQVQVYSGDALDALEKGLKDLIELNDIVKEKVLEAKKKFGPVELVETDEEQDLLPDIDEAELEQGEEEVIPEEERLGQAAAAAATGTKAPGKSTGEASAAQVPMLSEETW